MFSIIFPHAKTLDSNGKVSSSKWNFYWGATQDHSCFLGGGLVLLLFLHHNQLRFLPFLLVFGIFCDFENHWKCWESQWKKNLVTSAAVKTTSLLDAHFWENHWNVGSKSHLLNLCRKLHLTSNPWCGFQSQLGFLPKRDEGLRKTGSKN